VQILLKAVAEVIDFPIRPDVQAKKGIEYRNSGVLLLQPHVRDAVVFRHVRIGHPDFAYVGHRQIKLRGIFPKKAQRRFHGSGIRLGFCDCEGNQQRKARQPKTEWYL
jgi:hypothetical protein